MNDRQKQLLAKARRTLAAAQDLLRLGYHEDAISRAYYSMFDVAQAFLEGEQLRFRSHASVIGEFGRVFAKSGRLPAAFHRALIDAEEDRISSDYEEAAVLSREDAQKHVEMGEKFLQLAEDALGRS